MSKYDDMLYLEHPVSKKHPQMALADRAAQFSPFAALTGYEAVIEETARQTEKRPVLTEEEKLRINEKLLKMLSSKEEGMISFFVPDKKKEGGHFDCKRCAVHRVDDIRRVVITTSGEEIPLDDILFVEVSGEW